MSKGQLHLGALTRQVWGERMQNTEQKQEVELAVIPFGLLPYPSIILVVTESFQVCSSSEACILYPAFFLEFVEMLLGLTSLATWCPYFLTGLFLFDVSSTTL